LLFGFPSRFAMVWSISTNDGGVYKPYFFMKRKQTDTYNDLHKPTYTNHQEPTQHNTHQPNPQPTPRITPKQLKTIYQDSAEFFFRFSLGFPLFDEEWRSKVHGESKVFTFTLLLPVGAIGFTLLLVYLVHFHFTFTLLSLYFQVSLYSSSASNWS